MKIYGKTLPEIYNEMPSPYKFIVVLSCISIVLIIGYVSYQLIAVKVKGKDIGPVFLPGREEYKSLFDPAVAPAPDKIKNYMVYNNWRINAENQMELKISFAMTNAPCKTWLYQKDIFSSHKDDLIAPDGVGALASGEVRYETPAIVYDPTDKGREWKIFAYRYFWAENLKFAQRYSTIVMKTASDPLVDEWSTEEWMISAAPDYPPAPYQDMIHQKINALDPSLTGIISYGRPSVINVNNTLYMSLSAFRGDMRPEKIILLASTDHAKSWQYKGTLLNMAQIKQYGDYTKLGGGTLLVEDGKVYLAAVFGDKDQDGKGTFIFPFQDISTGALVKQDNGVPKLLRHIGNRSIAPTKEGGGYAAYSDSCKHGVLISEISGVRGTYQIFKTAEKVSTADK